MHKIYFLALILAILRLASWNVRGMRAREKQNEVIAAARENKLDILAVQETHINDVKYIKNFNTTFGVKSLWSLSIGRSGGVALLFFGRCKEMIIKHERDWSGRVITADLKLGFKILNLYAPLKSTQQIEFFNELDSYVNNARKLVVVGDYNCVENELADWVPVKDRKVTYGARALEKSKNFGERCNLNDTWLKLHPGYPTMTWKGGRSEARLDRIYVTDNLLADIKSVTVKETVISDHKPITIEMTTK